LAVDGWNFDKDERMADTYRAVLKDDHLEWVDKKPEMVNPVDVTVVVHDVPNNISQGVKMAYYLEKLAELGGVSSISDPVAWQREIREDRVLPGRDA
jgi:hypothetical protein